MEKLLKILVIAIVVIMAFLAVLLCLVAWDAHKNLAYSYLTLQNVNRTVIVAGAASANLQKTLAIEQQNAADQAKAFTGTINKFNSVLDQLNGVIVNANLQISL